MRKDQIVLPASQPAICVWENVPGVLNTKDNAFGCFLGALAGEDCELQPSGKKWSNAGCVFGPKRAVAWRVLDAQYFGVAQRRKRVFVVASARDGFRPDKVLFESEGLRRDFAPSREKGKEATRNVGTSIKTPSHWDGSEAHNTGGIGSSNQELFSQRGACLVKDCSVVASSTLAAIDYKDATDLALGHTTSVVHGTQDPCTQNELSFALGRNSGQENAIYPIHDKATRYKGGGDTRNGDGSGNGLGIGLSTAPSYTLTTGDKHGVFCGAVRRLTPMECERLQGFPDNHTQIPWRNKPADQCPDGQRYKAIGNSMAVPKMRWVGMRIQVAVQAAAVSQQKDLSDASTNNIKAA